MQVCTVHSYILRVDSTMYGTVAQCMIQGFHCFLRKDIDQVNIHTGYVHYVHMIELNYDTNGAREIVSQ